MEAKFSIEAEAHVTLLRSLPIKRDGHFKVVIWDKTIGEAYCGDPYALVPNYSSSYCIDASKKTKQENKQAAEERSAMLSAVEVVSALRRGDSNGNSGMKEQPPIGVVMLGYVI
ncbi:hypothetical protein LOAG_01034 [Loa loa]|uniref:Uncharacterized protein n=1 Tax=Loa loa TaxID=7209 RepID=A0A1S0U9W9_LOALO|nr:hypothetical protein LOAG_01034 [Loa loa]EFO27444.1 hypothetical protein LOAG_01034 [Loa loa]